ncbi:hypothetical protein CY34DRAFT_808874 [Suillus luteus UH-Slu-Lm8-n1]|uniref:Uncharacterized protein n=1 Tax=Suillus luteus UH-Slu-Lm8-n1 TaxID=930992 RepID=A0A0D0B516_9AGAM|nr:hypothetical protein CY34DRAFT_808874 [Suillus luteus UH-Slu-Lm8-n1]
MMRRRSTKMKAPFHQLTAIFKCVVIRRDIRSSWDWALDMRIKKWGRSGGDAKKSVNTHESEGRARMMFQQMPS